MGSTTLWKKLTITTGIRNEWTQDDGAGKFDNKLAYSKAIASGASVVNALLAEYSDRFKNTNKYSTTMGNLQMKYQITPELVLRGSWHMGIGRPDLPALLPQETVNEVSLPYSINVNNIGLKPQFAYNYDVDLDYYAKNSLTLSADIFQKNIRNYISSTSFTIPSGANNGFNGQYAGYIENTSYNMGEAVFKGVELNASQPFTGLMAIARDIKWLGNFGWFANWTSMRTEQIGLFPNGSGPSVYPGKPQANNRFQDWVPQTFNVGISYTWSNGAMVYVKYNERAKAYQYSQANLDVMQKAWQTVDLAIRYPLNKNYSVIFNVNNVFDDRTVFYVENGLNIRSDIFSTQLNLGIKGSF
jgi:iron complex outermembrane receptor protein